ncbi:MAG: glycosyltransferase family 39 protein [Candidatus Krumholzibacteria bacterium]|nr:glycosyltransferase family 39 protein [Candidatus Krumholzibacteria bacterium]
MRKSGRLTLCAIIAGAAFLRFFRLAHQSLWVDEILSYKAFTSVEGIPYWKKFLYDVHGPLYSLIMHAWSGVSRSDVWLRAPSAIAGVLAVYAFYRWFVESGRKDLAIPAALLMALSPFHLYYSQEMRFYSLLSLFAVVTLIAFERFLRNPTMRTGVALGISFALACLSHFSALFLGAAFVVYLAFSGRLRGDHLRFGAVAGAIVLVVIAPWIYRELTYLRQIRVVGISALPVEERLRGELTLSRWSYPYALYAFSTGYSLGPSLRELHLVGSVSALVAKFAATLTAVGVLFGGLCASGIVRSVRSGRLGLFLSVILVAVVLVTLITAFNIKVFNVRYLMCAFPLYLALVVYGLPGGRPMNLIVIGAVCAIMLVSDANYLFNPRYSREDVRGAAEVVMGAEVRGDIIFAPGVEEAFAHYYKGTNRIEFFEPASLGEARVDERIATAFASHARIWHIQSRSWDKDPENLLDKVLRRKGVIERSWDMPGVRLILCAPKGGSRPIPLTDFRIGLY